MDHSERCHNLIILCGGFSSKGGGSQIKTLRGTVATIKALS